MGTFSIKEGDTKPYLQVTLKDAEGSVIDLTSATVSFNMANTNHTPVLSSSATVTLASGGQVDYRWGSNDTSSAGVYFGEFEVTYSDGKIETFPADDSLSIKINKDYN